MKLSFCCAMNFDKGSKNSKVDYSGQNQGCDEKP
jgi:hypothetical protein